MDIESVRAYCLSLPLSTEDQPFGPDNLIFRVENKIFACLGLDGEDYFALKCNPDLAIELRDQYPDIQPAWHWNKKYWNQLLLRGHLTDDLVKSLIRHSYAEVVAKLPKKTREAHPEIAKISFENGQ